MHNNFFIIRETALYLNNIIRGYTIAEIYTQDKDKFIIRLVKSDQSIYLEFSAENRFEYVLIKESASRAVRNTVDLLGSINGSTVVSVSIKGYERLIDVELNNNIHLFLILIPGKGNAFVIFGDVITDFFKQPAGKEIFVYKSIFSRKTMRINDDDNIWSYLKSNFAYFGQNYFNEALHKSGLERKSVINPYNIAAIKTALESIENNIISNPSFLLYKNPVLIPSLCVLEIFEDVETAEFSNINELTSYYVSNAYYSKEFASLKGKLNAEYKSGLNNVEKRIKSLEEKIDSVASSERYRKYGDVLLTYIEAIEKGSDRYIFEDLETGKDEVIKLDASLSVSANAQKYYDKYKKDTGSINLLNKKLESLKLIKAEFEAKLKETESAGTLKELRKMKRTEETESEISKLPFRKFIIDKFEVWVGKDSASNDLLTTKYASQNDLWFHVRGAGGSHTILKVIGKNDVPGKEVIQSAARIAAYYSKARKAGNVPVAYCEKKYVKKKKGFKQGSVVMEREKVIFVKPGLPGEIPSENG